MDIRTRVGHVLNFLGNQRYALDVYQRGYVWTDREIRKFLTDLEDHAVDWIADPHVAAPLFLGTVILERRGETHYLVDGQQRVVTLGLLLLALHPKADKHHRRDIELALKGDNKQMTLPVAVGRYQLAFTALAQGKAVESFGARDEDQQRIAAAFFRMKDWIETSIRKEDLPLLIEGLLRRCLLNIVTVSDTDLAYRLFNSLNSRGKPLSTIEALKSVLLTDLDPAEREALAAAWDRARTEAEAGRSGDATLNALQSALIARVAPAVTHGSAFAASADVKAIRENPFHWLTSEGEDRPPAEQVARELPFFISLNAQLARAAETPLSGAEALHFVNAAGLPLSQWAPLVMAPLTPLYADNEDNARKAAAAIAFLDIAAARLTWSPQGATPAQIRDLLAGLAPHLRDADPEGLAMRLAAMLEGHAPNPFHGAVDAPRVGPDGLDPVATHALLARLTAFLETFVARPAGDYGFFAQGGAGGFTLTTIAAVHSEAVSAAAHARPGYDPLAGARDRLGAKVLAPRALTQQMDEAPLNQHPTLLSEAGNLLARTAAALEPRTAKRLQSVARGFNAPAGPPESLEDIDQREAFYAALAAELWSTERILDAAADPSPRLTAALGLAGRG